MAPNEAGTTNPIGEHELGHENRIDGGGADMRSRFADRPSPGAPAPSSSPSRTASRTSRASPSATADRALRDRGHGREAWTGAADTDPLATFLGWFSLGLGAAELLAPGTVARAIGVQPTTTWRTLLRLFGLRELATGAGILASPRSKEWVGMRVGGDAMDLATLLAALPFAERPSRTLGAAAVVLSAGMLDVLGTERLAERRKAPTRELAQSPHPVVVRSVTVGRPVGEVYAAWCDVTSFPRFMRHVESVESLGDGRTRWRVTAPAGRSVEWVAETTEQRPDELVAWRTTGDADLAHEGRVEFRPAPGGDGTVVTVTMQYAPPGGRITAALLSLFRKEPSQQVGDDLRSFKQLLEVGEVLRSDAGTGRPS